MALGIMSSHSNSVYNGMDVEKYEIIKNHIIAALRDQQGITNLELHNRIHEQLGGIFDGPLSLYISTVKLDLEAQGILEINRKSKSQKISLRQF